MKSSIHETLPMHLDVGTRELYLEIVQPLFYNSFCIDDWEWLTYKSAFCSYCQVWFIAVAAVVLSWKRYLVEVQLNWHEPNSKSQHTVVANSLSRHQWGPKHTVTIGANCNPSEKLYARQTPKLYNHRGGGGRLVTPSCNLWATSVPPTHASTWSSRGAYVEQTLTDFEF